MLYRNIASIAVAAILGVACISTDAFAYRAVYRGGAVRVGGVHRVGVYHGAYRGAYVRRGVAVGVGAAAIGAAAVGAAVAAPYYNNYYNSTQCGYQPYPALLLSQLEPTVRRREAAARGSYRARCKSPLMSATSAQQRSQVQQTSTAGISAPSRRCYSFQSNARLARRTSQLSRLAARLRTSKFRIFRCRTGKRIAGVANAAPAVVMRCRNRGNVMRACGPLRQHRMSAFGPFRHLVRRSDMSAIGVKAEVAGVPQIGRS